MAMTKTPIEIDDELLSGAADALGTKTKKDTVNAALRHVRDEHRRMTALRELRAMGDAGDYADFIGASDRYR